MFAVRLGSYSMLATLAGTLILFALEVDPAVAPLVSAAPVTGSNPAVVVAAARLLQGLQQALFRLALG
jgi:LDH2 family malate/lactate/ureidoglycolate dehydrogenase